MLFRTRSVERDRVTDNQRKTRLGALLADLQTEIEAEERGLRARLDTISRNAAFAIHQQEQGNVSRAIAAQVDRLTEEIVRGDGRVQSLKRHSTFLGTMIRSLPNWE